MAFVTKTKGSLTVTAYGGDAKTLLAFNLPKAAAKNLAGFTIQAAPNGQPPYFLFNNLQYENPGKHAQVAEEPANSTINAPIHKFRWLHVPGSVHQGVEPFLGTYIYTVTPRYFDGSGSMRPLDATLSVPVTIDVVPFDKGNIELSFTRGYIQSQAFVNHFGLSARIRPAGNELLYDTSVVSGKNAYGETYTYEEEYKWLGYTARQKIFELLDDVSSSKTLRLDIFAYDLDEPDIMSALLTLAAKGKLRMILDNASLHHDTKDPTSEDQFEALFNQKKKGGSAIIRGRFGRYAHDKIMIVSNSKAPTKVLTGSTNFSVTGLYVNSNHTIVITDQAIAKAYSDVFNLAWTNGPTLKKFQTSPLAAGPLSFKSSHRPKIEISFAPHTDAVATKIMTDLATRITGEASKGKTIGSVLFAIMDLGSGDGPVRPALTALHSNQTIFSHGISDTTNGIRLYSPKRKNGVLVTGKPTSTKLPPPFNQVPGAGQGHQIHHKFVVCGFNTPDAVVYCGSSNLATGGEAANGDNLLAIYDRDVATAFAIEALSLVDHFEFLDRYSATGNATTTPPAQKQAAAVQSGWFLSTTDAWTVPYYDLDDLRSVDRRLFGN
jgi:hypothetical protein